jgi:hypothetical protein
MITIFASVIFALTASLTSLALASGVEQTHSTVPSQNSSFIGDLQNFLKREDAQRYIQQFSGMVVSGGVDATGGALTHTPTALTAYPGGYYVTEDGSVTYVANSTCYLIATKTLTGNLATFQRQSGTHYLTDCTSASKPALPDDSLWLATLTTNGSSVTAYTDLRTRVPYAGSYPLAELPSAGQRGLLAIVTDVNSGTLYWDTGAAWRQVTLNPMTFAGDLITGGSSGTPTRLAIGTANQLLGVNSGATSPEYKTLAAGDGISITHTTGSVSLSATSAAPSGAVMPYAGTLAPTGWVLCDSTSYNATVFSSLAVVLIPSASVWGRGTAVGTFTVDTSTDLITLAAHGLSDGNLVHVASTTTLPGGLSANTVYYIRDAASSTFRLATSSGGSAIDLTSTGSGTHSLYDEVQVPDMRSRLPIGVGTGTYVEEFEPADVATGTEIITVASNVGLYTGTAVTLTSASPPSPLTTSTTYYVIRSSDTQIQLATSLANALAGTAINLTTTGSGTHTLTKTLTARALGQKGGEEGHYQLATEAYLDDGTTHGTTQIAGNNGGGANSTPTPFNVMNPFVGLNYIIKL